MTWRHEVLRLSDRAGGTSGDVSKLPLILQTRMESSRFPGKALKPLAGTTVFEVLLERLRRCRRIESVVIATTDRPADDALAALAGEHGIPCFRGSSEDVLSRVLACAERFGFESFVKLWGDSPLIDPALIDSVVFQTLFRHPDFDYASNNHPSTFPEGQQLELIRTSKLAELAAHHSITTHDREHVTLPFLRANDVVLVNYALSISQHDLGRLVVDFPEDLTFLQDLCVALGADYLDAGYPAMAELLLQRPELSDVNRHHYVAPEEYFRRIELARMADAGGAA